MSARKLIRGISQTQEPVDPATSTLRQRFDAASDHDRHDADVMRAVLGEQQRSSQDDAEGRDVDNGSTGNSSGMLSSPGSGDMKHVLTSRLQDVVAEASDLHSELGEIESTIATLNARNVQTSKVLDERTAEAIRLSKEVQQRLRDSAISQAEAKLRDDRGPAWWLLFTVFLLLGFFCLLLIAHSYLRFLGDDRGYPRPT